MKTIKDRHYSFMHTQQRLDERYNAAITLKDYDALCTRIKNKVDITLIEEEYQQNDTQIIYDMHFPHRDDIRVVWSESKQLITTALPKRKINGKP